MALSDERQGSGAHCDGQQRQSGCQNSLIPTELQHRPVGRGAPGSEIDRKPAEFSLDLNEQKSSRSSEQESNLSHKDSHDPSFSSQA